MTQKQLQLVKLINNYRHTTGEAPTYSEMKKAIGVTSNQTVSDHLDALERSGLIKRLNSRKRGIELTSKGKNLLGGDKNQIFLSTEINLVVSPEQGGVSGVSVGNGQIVAAPQPVLTTTYYGENNYVTNDWNHKSTRDSSSG